MPKTLYLIRHSYAESPMGKPDFDRTLTAEGVNTVRALGRYLIKSSFNPSVILCSPANRAKETVLNLIEELEISDKNIHFEKVIYNASVRELLKQVNSIAAKAEEVAVVGHNPAITYFAEYLTGESIGNMDPCGMVAISFEGIKWNEISQDSGRLLNYIHPKQLKT